MAAIIYKRGPPVPMLTGWLDTREPTIYRRFDRLEDKPTEQAIKDQLRSGRPPKLDDVDHEEFRTAVHYPPTEAGYDEPAWTVKSESRSRDKPSVTRPPLPMPHDSDHGAVSGRTQTET